MRKLKSDTVVIKIGTNTLTNEKGLIDEKVMKNLVRQIAEIKDSKKIILITSGAIGSGMQELGLDKKPQDIVMKQVCAGIGQSILMANYYSMFKRYKIKIAQILISYSDFENKKTYSNFINSLNKMLELGVIPIINENDPISIDEIGASFGDNDNLSALISKTIAADILVILTNVEGLYDKDPKMKGAKLIKEVTKIDSNIKSISGSASSLGLGGMKSKVEAAEKATKEGIVVIVANGKKEDVVIKVLDGEDIGTIFYS